MSAPAAVLERVTRVPGIRGSLLISASDGLVIAERVMDGIDARAVAALAGSLVSRLVRTTDRAAMRPPVFVQLRAAAGTVLAAPGPEDLVLVAVAGPEANVGLARIEMLEAVGRIA